MTLFDDPRLMPLEREDRVFVGFGVLVLIVALLGWLAYRSLFGEALTEVDAQELSVPVFRLNINEASWPEIALLPGIGEVLARRIVDQRESTGAFSNIDELDDVHGIGPKVLANIRPMIKAVSQPDVASHSSKPSSLSAEHQPAESR